MTHIYEGRGQWRGDRVGLTIEKVKDRPSNNFRLRPAKFGNVGLEASRMDAAGGIVPVVRYPIGCTVLATAVMRDPNSPDAMIFNVDMLEGGVDEEGNQYYWGIAETVQGSNAYLHYPEWIGLQSPLGTACSSWGGCRPNSIFAWKRGRSIEELLDLGPNGYGDSRT